MAVSISRDLTVQLQEDVNVVKLSDRQQALRAAIHKGEPKSLGVGQVMLGLMVMSFSIILHMTELTEVVLLGVPWWSGMMVMAVSISRDLTVQLQEDVNVVKLSDRQQALRAAIHKGEPKSLGVSQVMLGLMVMSFSIPLHMTELTEVVLLGVPWWSGMMFIMAGAVAITLDKHCTMWLLQMCLLASVVAAAVSVVAVIIYSVDMGKNPATPCAKTGPSQCNDRYFATRLSRGMKSSLLLFTLAQTVISVVLCFLLYRQKHNFGQYVSLADGAPSTPTATTLSDRD